jgi:hypothetical protein
MGILNENMGDEVNLLPLEDRFDTDYQTSLVENLTQVSSVVDVQESDLPQQAFESVLLANVALPAISKSPSTDTLTTDAASRWISLLLEINLRNVGLELLIEQYPGSPSPEPVPLARLEFRNSFLTFQGYTFGTLQDAGMSIDITCEVFIVRRYQESKGWSV